MTIQTKLNKAYIFKTLKEHAKEIEKFKVTRLGLFGSAVREKLTTKSDLDFLVEFKIGEKTYSNFIQTTFLLENIFDRKVDLITRNAIAEWLQPSIDEEIEYVKFSH